MSSSSASTRSPSPWQRQVGEHLSAALALSRTAHAPAHDHPAETQREPWESRWRVPARETSEAPAALARLQAADPVGRAQARSLLERCLHHYREHLRPGDPQDDAGIALACFLAACVQARDMLAVTPARWRAVHRWLEAWATDGLDWDATPLAQQQDFFERMASLAVAIGEWTVQASRQGEAALRTAQALASSSLKTELGLSMDELAGGLHMVMDLADLGADPSWGEAELPKPPTTRPGGHLL